MPLLNKFGRVPVCGLIAQYNGLGPGDGSDHLPTTMREILSKSLTLRGFIYHDFAEQHYGEFLKKSGPPSPEAAFVIAKTSWMVWRMPPKRSSVCLTDVILVRPLCG
jgi:hypothetical protein